MSHKGYNRITAHNASHTDTDSSGLAPGKESRSRISCLAAAVTVGGTSPPSPSTPPPPPPPSTSLSSLSLSHTHTSANLSSVTGECDSRRLRSLAAAFSLPQSFWYRLWRTFLRSNLLQLCITCKRHRCLHQGQKCCANGRKEQLRSKTWHKTERAVKQRMA